MACQIGSIFSPVPGSCKSERYMEEPALGSGAVASQTEAGYEDLVPLASETLACGLDGIPRVGRKGGGCLVKL